MTRQNVWVIYLVNMSARMVFQGSAEKNPHDSMNNLVGDGLSRFISYTMGFFYEFTTCCDIPYFFPENKRSASSFKLVKS